MQEKEEWREIVDVQIPRGFYQVSNFGRVRSMPREIVQTRLGKEVVVHKKGGMLRLGKRIRTQNYANLFVQLGAGKGKRRYVHRLVATAFVPNPENKPEVNHIDCNPLNNRADNLEWVTHKENMGYAYSLGRGFNMKPVKSYNETTGETKFYKTAREASSQTGASWRHISACCCGKRKHSGGLMWSFANPSEADG